MKDEKGQITGDAQLVSAALSGGAGAFAPLVRRYQDAVFAVALSRLGNFHDAEDVAQETFVEAFARLGTLKSPARLGAWLRSIAIHRSIDRLRRKRPVNLAVDAAESACCREQKDMMELRELQEQVMAAISGLPKAPRETVMLFYMNGYSVEEVASIQSVPLGTVKRRLHEARKELKKEMVAVVEDLLKSEAPKHDFADGVFKILCQSGSDKAHPYDHAVWRETIQQLRKIGANGIEGFVRALESPHSPTRVFAAAMLERRTAPLEGEAIITLLLKALEDPNRKVRRHAVEALLVSQAPDERKRTEFVPRITPLLSDPSKRVRRTVAWALRDYASEVPMSTAAKVLLEEEDFEARRRQKSLLHAIVHEGEFRFYPE